MRVSARVDYGIRALVELAAAAPHAVKGEELAQSQEISQKFLENILQQLKANGFVRAQRGADGGYRLARAADAITLAQVIRALEGPLANVRGERPENITFPGVAAPMQQVWIAVRASLRGVLDQVTLADVANQNLPDVVRQLVADPGAWQAR